MPRNEMINFDAKLLRRKLSAVGLTLKEASLLMGRSDCYMSTALKNGRMNSKDFYWINGYVTKQIRTKELWKNMDLLRRTNNETV